VFYITVLAGRRPAVVTDGRGRARSFPKAKKAYNFVEGRPYLRAMKPRVVESLNSQLATFKVDL